MSRYAESRKIKIDRIFLSFHARFPTERECIEKLLEIRKRKFGSLCKMCNGEKGLVFLQKSKKIRCKKCGGETAFTYGSIFYCSKMSLHKWFQLMWLWSNSPEHSNAKKLAECLGWPFSTTFGCLQRLRSILSASDKVLFGKVECDLLKLHRGSLAAYYSLTPSQKMACVAVNARTNGAGQVRMMEIEDFDLEKYEEFKSKNIDSDTIEKRGAVLLYKIATLPINHEPVTDDNPHYSTLPSVNKIAGELDAWLWDNFHGAVIPSRYMQEYLDEFCFRWNNRYDENGRNNKERLFEKVLERAVLYSSAGDSERMRGDKILRDSHSLPAEVG